MTSTLRIEARLSNLAVIRRFVEDTATALEASPEAIRGLILAVDESITNIIVHGYRGRGGSVEIELGKEGDSLVARIRDQAPPFDPTAVPPPDLSVPLDERPLGGLGIHLTRQFMDAVIHRVTPQGGNELTLVKSAHRTQTEEELGRMSISVQQTQGRVPVAIMSIDGALDASNYQDLIATAREVYAAGTRHILLDMAHTSFMSSSGIVALHSIALLLRGQPAPDPESGWAAIHSVQDTRDSGTQPHLKLLNPLPQVEQTLDRVGLAGVFEVHTDLATAIASF